MIDFRFSITLAAATFLAISSTGCEPPASVELPKAGQYEGTVIIRNFREVQQSLVSVTLPSSPDFEKDPQPIVFFEVPRKKVRDRQKGDAPRKTVFTVELGEATSDSIEIRVEPFIHEKRKLHFEDGCFVQKGGDNKEHLVFGVRLCTGSDSISLEMADDAGQPVFSVGIRRFEPQDLPSRETPRAFDLYSAIQHAKVHGYANRVEFVHVLQAKYNMKFSYAHLTPQLTMGTMMNMMTPSFMGAIQSIGDLAPFLLPNRWLLASASDEQFKAEKVTKALVSMDSASQVEGLYYAYDRDVTTLHLLEECLAQARELREQVITGVEWGRFGAGALDDMLAIINTVEQAQIAVAGQVDDDRAAISTALGFFSPDAVSEASIGKETNPIERAEAYDAEDVTELAVSRSLELQQLDHLGESIKELKKAKYLTWLDPAGDPNLGLGYALRYQLATSTSQIREILVVQKGMLKGTLANKAKTAVKDYTQAVKLFASTATGVAIQKKRRDTAITKIEIGGSNDLFAMVQIFQDYVGAGIAQANATAIYRLARARIDRLLLQGYYAN